MRYRDFHKMLFDLNKANDSFAVKVSKIAIGFLLSYLFTYVLYMLVYFRFYARIIEDAGDSHGDLSTCFQDANIFLYFSEQFLRHTSDAFFLVSNSLLTDVYSFDYFFGVLFLVFAPCILFLFKQNFWTLLYLTAVMSFWIIFPNLMSV